MKAYLSPLEGQGTVPIESRAEVYRSPENGQEITIETDRTTTAIGVADVTVSRKKGNQAPVVIESRAECIEVRNEANANGVHIKTEGNEKQIDEGFSARITRDAELSIGYQTELRLTVEREARKEYVIDGQVEAEGDVVMGDQRNVDDRTTVEDVVAKEVNVNGDEPAEVQDTVANDINVGVDENEKSDTQNVCEKHGIAYTGHVCPKCATEKENSKNEDADTNYCIFCGESIPPKAKSCPACGKDLAEE